MRKLKLPSQVVHLIAMVQAKKVAVMIVTALLLLAAVTAVLNQVQSHEAAQQKQLALAQLLRDQKAKADELAKQLTTVSSKPDISDLQFKDISDVDFKKPVCKRLENRPGIVITNASCDYRLRAHGKLTMAVVYVYESTTDVQATLSNPDASDTQSLAYINTYLTAQAKRYKVADPPSIAMTFFGPYKTVEPVDSIYYYNNGNQLIDIYNRTSSANKVPEDQYDMVQFVLLDHVYGGVAFPWLHRAFTYDSYGGEVIPVFIHETLHLFGATDKYNNNDCSTIGTNDPFGRYNGTLPGSDIMCASYILNGSEINDITAREIGWAN